MDGTALPPRCPRPVLRGCFLLPPHDAGLLGLRVNMDENARENERVMKAAYDEYYENIVENGFRHTNMPYILGKANSDWRLLSRLDLRGKRILNIACAEPIDELYWAGFPFKEWIAVD